MKYLYSNCITALVVFIACFWLGPSQTEYLFVDRPVVVEREVLRVPTVDELIEMEFSDPVMQVIAQCESGRQHFAENGEVLISRTSDYGVFQINQIHLENAQSLGYDITTPWGNVAYARYLYRSNGTDDWYMSKHCWSNHLSLHR